MKSIKYLFTLLLLAAALPLLGQQQSQQKAAASNKPDAVGVNKVDFKKLQPNEIQSSEGQWTRIEVELQILGNPDENANNQQWVRNIDVELTLVYKDEKAKDKKALENMVVMKSKARLFAGKVNSKVPVVFYIPGEAYPIYRIMQEPFAWSVQLSVNGAAIPLTKNNYKSMLSKVLTKSSNLTQVLESYKKLVDKASQTNSGVLIPLPNCPFNVQWYEYFKNTNLKIPTYIKEEGR